MVNLIKYQVKGVKMSEYDFVFEPKTPEQIAHEVQDKEVDNFTSSIGYDDMIILKKYVLKHQNLFSRRFIMNVTYKESK